MVLRWMGDPDVDTKMKAYREKMEARYGQL